jgi:hypothetical protein
MEVLDHVLQHTELLVQANQIFSTHVKTGEDSDLYEIKTQEKAQAVIKLALNDLNSQLLGRDHDQRRENEKVSKPELLGRAEEHLYVFCLLQRSCTAAHELLVVVKSQHEKSRVGGWRLVLPKAADIPFLAAIINRNQESSSCPLDAEHLPPRNTVEKFGNVLRRALSTLDSNSSKFGFRIVAATMSIGIMAFLKQTQHFFIEYRLVWAVVMIPISMSPTAGTAIYGFIGRALGVAAAMALAYINWYIVDGRTGGVIPMFFVSMMVYYFLLLRYPRFTVLFILAAANHVLIIGKHYLLFFSPKGGNTELTYTLIGYELQVSVKLPTAIISPQRYFPVYTLAPYRLLCILAGLLVAFIFTLFPVQISEHKILRKKVARSLAVLANYSSSVSVTLDQRIRGLEGDTDQISSPGRVLKAKRISILFEELTLLTEMRQISAMVLWEVSLGGKFPKSSYDRLVDEIQR